MKWVIVSIAAVLAFWTWQYKKETAQYMEFLKRVSGS